VPFFFRGARPYGRACILAVVSVWLVAALFGCKPKPGATCSAAQVACLGASMGMFCGADGVYRTMTCSGPMGCQEAAGAVNCDNSFAAVGDGCNTPDDAACSLDHKAGLLCKSGAFALAETCKGPGACKVAGDAITCDNDVSDPDDPCRTPGDYACTGDRGLVLRCDGGKMTPLNTCRGPKACSIINHPADNTIEFACDDSLAMVGDPCDTNGEEACTMDKKSILVCENNKFAKPRACGGAAGCTYEEKSDSYVCDQGDAAGASAPDAGAPGDGKGGRGKAKR
jgi:hypothetical protein